MGYAGNYGSSGFLIYLCQQAIQYAVSVFLADVQELHCVVLEHFTVLFLLNRSFGKIE